MVLIQTNEYLKLQQDAKFLRILEEHGVNNWDGYYGARQEFLYGDDDLFDDDDMGDEGEFNDVY